MSLTCEQKKNPEFIDIVRSMTIPRKSKSVEMCFYVWTCVESGCAEFDVVVNNIVSKKSVCEFSWEAYVTKYYRFEFFFVVRKAK